MKSPVIAVIPARGGSRRIPRKNIRPFLGRPMIAWSIEAARAANCFDRIIVSTEDAEIAAIARQYGAEVPFWRPADLADDHTTTTAVISHAVQSLEKNGESPAAVCCIYATAPFLRANDLQEGFAIFQSGNWRYVFAATAFGPAIFRSFAVPPSRGVQMFFPEHFTTRSQDLPEAFFDAGLFYWGQPDAWVNGDRVFAEWSTVVRLPSWRVQDIDTEEDWQRAELLAMSVLRTAV